MNFINKNDFIPFVIEALELLNITKDEVDEGLQIISKAISIADQYCN